MRQAEEDEFETWYAAAWPRVVRAVTTYLADPTDAADLAADACARTLSRWDGPDRPRDPTTWTIVVAINQAKRRGQRDEHRRELVGAVAPGPTVVELGDVDVDLWEAVTQLPPREREAVALRYAADLTEPAVADAMGISPGAVAATLNRARAKLRTALGETHRG